MDHIGVIVDDLEAAIAFFVDLGFEASDRIQMEGRTVDRLIGLDGVKTEFAFVRTPDGSGQLELIKFLTPAHQDGDSHAPANALGLRHIAFAVENIDAIVAGLKARGAELVGELVQYEDSWKLCYVRGPEGIIVELAEQIG
jgi:catechol 2,3-dioxygenase-like lactoylglutathione lyase family enzyme